MKGSYKIELWKATHNVYFFMAMIIGFMLTFCNISETYSIVTSMTQDSLEGQKNGLPFYRFTGCSLFLWWIAHNGFNAGSIYFYNYWPILAALPFSWSCSKEAQNGSNIQFCVRSNRKSYFFSKFLAVFVSGGIAVSAPILTDLMLNALICPDESLLFYNMLTNIENPSFLASLFYTHPWIHALIWCGVEFLWGGAVAVLCFFIGKQVRFPLLNVLVPFSVLYIMAVIGKLIYDVTGTSLEYNPLQLAMQAPSGYNPEWLVFSIIILFTLSSFIYGYWQVRNHDFL